MTPSTEAPGLPEVTEISEVPAIAGSTTDVGGDGQSSRPRVEGDREREILDATLDVLAEVGYDKLTMDAVAARAKASKATLYRRWSTKQALVVDSVCSQKASSPVPDTGTLRGDLVMLHCELGGFRDARSLAVLAAVVTAMARDEEFAETYRRDFIGPKVAASRVIFDRARERGELGEGVDVALLAPALPGIVLHRVFLLGEEATPDLIAQIIDQIIIPAATCQHRAPASASAPHQALHPHQQGQP